MTPNQAKAIGLTSAITGSKHARTVQAVMEMRKLLNDIDCGNGLGLSNPADIKTRLERIHDGLAKEFGMEKWQELWVGVSEGKKDWPTFS